MLDILLDAVIDSLKIVPVLLLAYLLIEFWQHKKGRSLFSKKTKTMPVTGALLGSIPQCGISAVSADLYSKKQITIGTLFAVFIATSDEAIILLLGNYKNFATILLLVAIKIVYAVIIGLIIDLILKKYNKNKLSIKDEQAEQIQHKCCCSDTVFIGAFKHTVNIFIFVLIINLVLGFTLHFVGFENVQKFFSGNEIVSVFLSALIGLIPNCSASVLLIEMFTSNLINFAALVAGLTSGAGIGIMILFKKNKNIKQNLLITGSLMFFAILIGLIISMINFI